MSQQQMRILPLNHAIMACLGLVLHVTSETVAADFVDKCLTR